MNTADADKKMPRGFIPAAGALIVASLVLALIARVTDVGAVRLVHPPEVQSIDLRFEDRVGGKIAVVDASTGDLLKLIKPGQDGFVRVAIRSLAFERRARGTTSSGDFRLGRAADGTYWLKDLATGRVLQLEAYGHGNLVAFSQFLSPRRTIE